MLGSAQVISALNLVDGRHVKIDAGSEAMFLEMNSPTFDIGLYDVMRHLSKLNDFTVQSMFTRGRRDNAVDAEVEKWIEVIAKVKPKEVHIYTLERPPADGKIRAVEPAVLQSIAQRLTARTGVSARVW
jgi:wyosine [tRNA(Phe)-imidazoG37] synthetase (radical SAM superfamily)